MAKLDFPPAKVGSEFMDEDYRIAMPGILNVELHSISIDISHHFSPHQSKTHAWYAQEAEHLIEMQSCQPEYLALA